MWILFVFGDILSLSLRFSEYQLHVVGLMSRNRPPPAVKRVHRLYQCTAILKILVWKMCQKNRITYQLKNIHCTPRVKWHC